MDRSVLQPVGAGLVAAVTGWFGSSAVLLAGLAAAGATPGQAASGLLALCVVQGVLSIVLSAWRRVPLCFVWSTPGAALLIGAGRHPAFGAAVGAFALSGLLVVVTGLVPALARLVDRIPTALTGALLAGVLWPFCSAPATAAVAAPASVLPLVAGWLVLARIAPRVAGPAVIVAAIVVTVLQGRAGVPVAPVLAAVPPLPDALALVGLGLPLFLVTMAGQNLTGLAVVRANGHVPPTRAALVAGGLGSIVAAPFGGVQVNLAAITGAITAGPDAGADPARRWPSGVAAGAGYLVLAPLAGVLAGLVGRPPLLVEAAVGLALLQAFVGALATAIGDAGVRVPAAIAFLVVASGITVAGVGSALWGLVAGGGALLVLRRRRA